MGRLELGKLPAGAKVGLDTVAIIYFLEHHPVHYAAARNLFLQIETGKISGVMSSLVFCELLVPVYRAGDEGRAREVIRLLMDFPNLEVVAVTPEISVQAAKLRAKYGLRTPDAIHAATALESRVDGIVANDKDFSSFGQEIPVWLFENQTP